MNIFNIIALVVLTFFLACGILFALDYYNVIDVYSMGVFMQSLYAIGTYGVVYPFAMLVELLRINMSADIIVAIALGIFVAAFVLLLIYTILSMKNKPNKGMKIATLALMTLQIALFIVQIIFYIKDNVFGELPIWFTILLCLLYVTVIASYVMIWVNTEKKVLKPAKKTK